MKINVDKGISMDFGKVCEDYQPATDIMEERDEFEEAMKLAVAELKEWQQNLIILYAELQSIPKVAKVINASGVMVTKMLKEIKTALRPRVYEIYNEIKDK